MLKLTNQIEINAPIGQVWQTLADMEAISRWSSRIDAADYLYDGGDRIGSNRTCQVDGVGQIAETITHWGEGRSLAYDIIGFPMIRYSNNRWDLHERNGQTLVKLTTKIEMDMGILGGLVERFITKGRVNAGMQQLLHDLKYDLETA